MTDIGLNLFQILQNELLSRETSRGNIGLGSRFASITERQKNASAVSHNSRVWRPNHALAPVSALMRECTVHKRKEKQTENAKTSCDPTQNLKEEVWEVHGAFPRTVKEFKQLRFHRRFSLAANGGNKVSEAEIQSHYS
jgi:hypothetical protein